jgi:hypothetical protein
MRLKILEGRTMATVWGTHIERRVTEMGAKWNLNPNWIAQNHPRFRNILKGSTHKNPHNQSFLKLIGEWEGIGSLRK